MVRRMRSRLLEFPESGPEFVDPEVVRAYGVPLTKQAVELRRVRDEHLSLIESIPPTPGVTPTPTAVERQRVASTEVRLFPDGCLPFCRRMRTGLTRSWG